MFDGDLIKAEYLGGSDRSKKKIALFDLDGTIIVTKSGKTFPQNIDDWRLLDSNIPKYLKKLSNIYEYRFVIISNQMGISKKSVKLDDFKKKIENILKVLNLPCTIFIAPADNRFRKPNIGVWEFLLQESASLMHPIDVESSFIVGDAAGRKKSGKGNKSDHSSADLLFASNSCIKFVTPEKFFKHANFGATFELKDELSILIKNNKVFNPLTVLSKCEDSVLLQDSFSNEEFCLHHLPEGLHCILFCGLPGTGKSTFFRNHLEQFNYDYVNRDTLKTMPKCIRAVNDALRNGRNCVVDNTNVNRAHRSQFIEIANKYNASIVGINFDLPIEQIFHNLKYRKLVEVKHQDLQKVAVYYTRKHFESMKIEEGFCKILKANFSPVFPNQESKMLYSRYLLDN